MARFGKTIRIYLADGSPTGIRHAELVNWTGQAVVCPRARISELADWKEAQRPGVYFLFGEGESDSRPMGYVGEAENVLLRLQSHMKGKDFWTQAVFFTSKDENLTKAHVKYLEARLVLLATEANRVRLENSTAPQLPSLPRADRDSMEDFLEPLRVLLGTLGFPVLQGLPSRAESHSSKFPAARKSLINQRLRFAPAKRVIDAEGAVTDEGFVVYQGAIGDAELRAHLGPGWRAYREELIADGSVVVDGKVIRFTRDVLFTSPSAAAAVVAGGQYNGREAWKDEDGTTLKELEEQLWDGSGS